MGERDRDEMPEEPNLTSETFSDPFWQVVIQSHEADANACERALEAQAQKDNEWHRQTADRIAAEQLSPEESKRRLNEDIQAYFAQPRTRCVCGDHRPGGMRE
jgi:hypothetical protein